MLRAFLIMLALVPPPVDTIIAPLSKSKGKGTYKPRIFAHRARRAWCMANASVPGSP